MSSLITGPERTERIVEYHRNLGNRTLLRELIHTCSMRSSANRDKHFASRRVALHKCNPLAALNRKLLDVDRVTVLNSKQPECRQRANAWRVRIANARITSGTPTTGGVSNRMIL